tara:strand:- start:908 stop:1354 length:447 start_codon:yes stop_codon:yes gene_type:complete
MNKVALIKENGEVATVCSTQLDNMYIDGEMYGDLMAKQLPLDADNQEFIQLKFWSFESGQWMARTERTGGYMVWSNNNWVLDNSELVLEIRQYRDSYLFSSDWTQFPDSPLTTAKKAEWVTYRQSLRDVPEDYSGATSLDDVVWPTKP